MLEQMTDDFLGHVSREEEKAAGRAGDAGEEEGKRNCLSYLNYLSPKAEP